MQKTAIKTLFATTAALLALHAMAQTTNTDSMAASGSDTSAMSDSASSPHGERSTSRSIADKTITTKIDAKFLADAEIKSRELKVRTYKGVVHLSGSAETQDQVDHAIEVAKGVDGVKNVKSNIKVKAAG